MSNPLDTPAAPPGPERRVGYVELLRRNRAFRNIWLAEVVSLLGDWFSTITLFAMLLEFTGKGEAVGFALVARFLPTLVFGPLAGVVADRYSRKTVLITCDVLRCLVVLGFVLVRDAGDVWLAYALTFVQLSLSTFFEVAESAAVGNVVTREEIVTANAIQGVTWSAMLAFGALLGGAVASLVGRTWAFCIDSVSFLVSAAFVARAAIPYTRQVREGVRTWAGTLGLRDAADGVRYVLRTEGVRGVILVKAGWGLAGGGALMLYSVFGERVFPLGAHAAISIGAIYAARGVGALVGPLLARAVGDDREPSLWRAITLSFFGMVLAYLGFALAPALPLAAFSLCLAHMGVSTSWVFSTALLNLKVPDELKGRAFAADNALYTLTIIISIFATSYGLDHLGLSPRVLMAGLALLLILPAVGFQMMRSAERSRDQAR